MAARRMPRTERQSGSLYVLSQITETITLTIGAPANTSGATKMIAASLRRKPRSELALDLALEPTTASRLAACGLCYHLNGAAIVSRNIILPSNAAALRLALRRCRMVRVFVAESLSRALGEPTA